MAFGLDPSTEAGLALSDPAAAAAIGITSAAGDYGFAPSGQSGGGQSLWSLKGAIKGGVSGALTLNPLAAVVGFLGGGVKDGVVNALTGPGKSASSTDLTGRGGTVATSSNSGVGGAGGGDPGSISFDPSTGAIYRNGEPTYMFMGGNSFRDMNTGQMMTAEQITGAQQQGNFLTTGQSAVTGQQMFRQVPGGFAPVDPSGGMTSSVVYPTLPQGGVLVNDLRGGRSVTATDPLASPAFKGLPKEFGVETPLGKFTLSDTGVAYSSGISQQLADRLTKYDQAIGYYESEAAKLDLEPLVKAAVEPFAAQRTSLSDSKRAALSTSQDMFARNRLSGSSFAADALSRTEAEFAKAEKELTAQESQVRATAKLKEIDMRQNLMSQAMTLRVEAAKEAVTSLFQEGALAAQWGTQLTGLMQDVLDLENRLAVGEAQSIRAALFGDAANVRNTTTTERMAEATRTAERNKGIGSFLGDVFDKPLEDLIDRIFA